MILIDPHGKLAEEVAAQKSFRNRERLVYIHPGLDHSERRFPIINPLDIPIKKYRLADQSYYVQRIARSFLAMLESRDSGLSSQMLTILEPCLHVLIRRS